jgi:hypothetical protein
MIAVTPLVIGRRWAPARAALVAVAAGALTLAAACGAAGPSGNTTAATHGSSTTAAANSSSAATGPLAFSACMRSHGIPDYPDSSGPTRIAGRQDGQIQVNGVTLKETQAQFETAQQACASTRGASSTNAPPNPQLQQAALQYSQCMRSHGIANFPDPKVTGNNVQIQIGNPNQPGGGGIDPNSPQFQAAQTACQGIMASALPAGGPGGPNGGNG